jgi:hypothetical protein
MRRASVLAFEVIVVEDNSYSANGSTGRGAGLGGLASTCRNGSCTFVR